MHSHRNGIHLIAYLILSQLVACVVLTVSLFLMPTVGTAEAQVQEALTIGVQIKGPVPIAIRNLSEYVRVISVRDDTNNALEMDTPVHLKQGYHLDVEILEGVDFFRFAKPVPVQLHAPLYLGKHIQVAGVYGADLAGKKATVEIGAVEPVFTVEARGAINYLDQDRRIPDDDILLTFKDDEILAYAPKKIGMQPVRKRSFELLDRWVSAGDQVRIKVPMPNMEEATSHLVVGFWTDNDGSTMEEGAYLAEISGIEPEKIGGSTYIVKVNMPYLAQLSNVVPGWYCPYPPLVKMTVTTQIDTTQIVSETFYLRVTRRGWGVTAGLLFLFVVMLTTMRITKNYNPFDKDSERYQAWAKTYKTGWLKRFFFSPLDIAVTPFGTYSISVAQVLFWTLIVAFSCVYVYMLKAAFLAIPDQILLLLGITGGTALTTRINSMSRDAVPAELIQQIDRKEIPRLRDMMCIAGKLNIYKFQMLVFTVITGFIVIVELIKACNFPEIPNTLIVLMGLSNTLYLGNEVAVEPIEGLRGKIKDYKEEKDELKKKTQGEEIIRILSQY